MVQGVWSENLEQQIDATTQFRKLLSIGVHIASPPITESLPLQRMRSNVLPFCFQRGTHRSKKSSARESSRALCSFCSVRMHLNSK